MGGVFTDPSSLTLIERAIEAHGGLGAWRAATSISFSFGPMTGGLPILKGYGRTFRMPAACEVRPHDGVVLFHGYPEDGHLGRYANGDVQIESTSDRRVVLASRRHRETFRGLRKYRRWTALDALYFFGYAVGHYHVMPYALTDARLVGVVRQGSLKGVEVDFPADVETHCRRQRVFFGADGRIARHDYVAEIIGGWARGCHFWEDYENVGGVAIAGRRRVLARLFGRPIPAKVLDVRLTSISVR